MEFVTFDVDSEKFRVKILDSASTTGAGKTGLAFNSAGLIISTIADNESAPTVYTTSGGTIETVTTLGTYAAPTATKCRFREVDATNHPGLYELQFDNARLSVASAKKLYVSISGASGMVQVDKCILLNRVDLQDATAAGISRIDATVSSRLATSGYTAPDNTSVTAIKAKTDQLTFTSNKVAAQVLLAGDFFQTFPASFSNLTITSGKVDVNDKTGFSLANGSIAAATFSAGAITATVAPNLDAAVSSRMATFTYTAPDNTTIGLINAKTTNLPSDPASNTQVNTRLATSAYTAPDNTGIAAVKAKTDNLPADPASNTQVNTRLATSGYTAPDNTSITAIKAKTDNLPVDPADASDVAASFGTVSSALSTIASYIDTEVAAIKAKTDNLPVDPADASDIAAAMVAVADAIAAVNSAVAVVQAKTDQLNFTGTDVKATLDGEVVTTGGGDVRVEMNEIEGV